MTLISPAAKAIITRRRNRSKELQELLQLDWGDGGPSADDFTVKTEDGYLLRVEQMKSGQWWWEVYYPEYAGSANPTGALDVQSEYIAKKLCELIYNLHRKKN